MKTVLVGLLASSELGVLGVEASPGWVAIQKGGAAMRLSPNIARELGALLGRAADVAEASSGAGSGAVPIARITLAQASRAGR
jgi:hypothetical protein